MLQPPNERKRQGQRDNQTILFPVYAAVLVSINEEYVL